jgi:adenylate cyclase
VPEGPRRLAAIMFTDMVGFTAMAQRDEGNAIRLLDEQRSLVQPLFTEHGGRVIKSMGDGFLVEFASAVESVRCAQKIQAALGRRNASVDAAQRVELRIGIHVGDILGQGEDIVGDAVNVASRLEPLAEPGGVCVSEQVVDQVRNKLPVGWEPLADARLKNVESPMGVYRLVAAEHGAMLSTPLRGAGATIRLAVLPFSSLSVDPGDELFADGLTEELITHLAHETAFGVVARTSVMQYKGTSKGIREIGRELAVGSILQGSVRRSDKTLRIAVQLVDVGSEEHLWANRFDRELLDILAVQDEIAHGVARALQRTLVSRTPPGLRNRRPDSSSGQNPRVERTTSSRASSERPNVGSAS